MNNTSISKDVIANILQFIQNENISALDSYLLQNDISLKVLNNREFDVLVHSIEHGVSENVIKYLIENISYPNFNYCVQVKFYYRNPLFSAIGYNRFEVADLLLENKTTDINYMNGEIINNLSHLKLLNTKNIKYILHHGYNLRYVTNYLILELIQHWDNEILESILTFFKYDTNFILRLLNIRKSQNPVSTKDFRKMILEEKGKISLKDKVYQYPIQTKNYDMVRILFENESHSDRQIQRKVVKDHLLELAVSSNNVSFVEKVLGYVHFNYKFFNYESIFTECIDKNKNMEMAQLLIQSFIKNSAHSSNKNKILTPSESTYTLFGWTVPPEHVLLLLNLMIKLKSIPLVKYIVEAMDKPAQWLNGKDILGSHPLITSMNNFELFHYLLEYGADCNTKNNQGMSILSLIIQAKKPRCWFDCLMTYDELKVNEKDFNGNTPLRLAVYQNNSVLVERLIDYAEDHAIVLDLNDREKNNDYVLFKAIHQECIDNVILLVNYSHDHGIDLNLHDRYGDTPLTLTYNLHQPALFHYLLQYLDVNQKDRNEKSLIFYVIDAQDQSTLNALVNVGADLNAKDPSSSDTVLHYAIKYGNMDMLRTILKRSNLWVNEKNGEGDTPMLQLVKDKKYSEDQKKEIATQLLRLGSNLDMTDSTSKSPIYYALYQECYDLVDLFLHHGASLCPEPEEITYDIMKCLIKGDKLNLLKLLMRNFDVNTQNKVDGNTLLHYAISFKKQSIINYLVKDVKADTSIKNNQGYNAFQWNDYLHYSLFRDEIDSLLRHQCYPTGTQVR